MTKQEKHLKQLQLRLGKLKADTRFLKGVLREVSNFDKIKNEKEELDNLENILGTIR